MSKKLKIGLFGFGHVGQGFCELLEKTCPPQLEIKTIGIKNINKPRKLNKTNFTDSINDIIDDPEIDLIVELIDDAAVAFEILKASLQKRKPVVTANKKMLAENLKEVYFLQNKYQTPVRYEGAVCGSIPIIQTLESYYALERINKIEGILNGSTNYILTKMIEERIGFQQALSMAMRLGFAESDPTLDINGEDAKYKLAILIAHAFNVVVDPDEIITIGIDKISQHDIRFAAQQNCTIKLIAKVEKIGNTLLAVVAPQFIPLGNQLSKVNNESNGVNIAGEAAGEQTLIGKGAGGLPTGLAVLSDVVHLTGQPELFYRQPSNRNLRLETGLVNVYIRFEVDDQISVNDFVEFEGGFHGNQFQTMEGWITSETLIEWLNRDGLAIILKKGQNITKSRAIKAEEYQLI